MRLEEEGHTGTLAEDCSVLPFPNWQTQKPSREDQSGLGLGIGSRLWGSSTSSWQFVLHPTLRVLVALCKMGALGLSKGVWGFWKYFLLH